jgi:fatty-acyl-CoA synthase
LEQILAGLPGVLDAAVVGVPDPRWVERPVGLLEMVEGRNVSLEAANTAILELVQSGEVSRYAPLDRPHAVEALPRTSVGKIEKKLIRTQPATLTTQGGA